MPPPQAPPAPDTPVPGEVIPSGSLPPLRYRDLPEPISLRRMMGPGIILAGLSLGSGEFILWPYITYRSGFVFFWACLLGVTTQYFINMEITRWTLATGESALTGFCRLSKHWAWVFLILNIIPWMIPAWASGAAQIFSWLVWGAQQDAAGGVQSLYTVPLTIGGMVLCGLILTAGPVIYETVEKVQGVLVALVLLLVVMLAIWLVPPSAVAAQFHSTVTLGHGQFVPELSGAMTTAMLLGALAFAGAGGTLNLGQSNYVKDKGYGMGSYIGRITSPITGRPEPVSEIGYHFPATDANMARWKIWWRRAGVEHFVSFYMTCVACLVLLTLVSYSIFYDADGARRPGAQEHTKDIQFIWGEADQIEQRVGTGVKVAFLVMGIAILLTTEFGVLDASSRISTDIVKVNYLGSRSSWSESRIYYCFLWGTIVMASGLVLVEHYWLARIGWSFGALGLFKLTAAMNGAVMFLYSMTLLYMNLKALPPPLRMSWPRVAVMVWSVLFFGFFVIWAIVDQATSARSVMGYIG